MTARVAPWSEVAGTYTVDFGKVLTHNTTHKLIKERDVIKDITKTGTDLVNGAKKAGTDAVKGVVTGAESIEEAFKKLGTADISKPITFSVGIGTPGLRTNIVTNAEWVLISSFRANNLLIS